MFGRWSKRECCLLAQREKFSLAQLAALAQSPRRGPSDTVPRKRLAAALHLHALATGCENRLIAHVWDPKLAEKYEYARKAIGARDVQRLALRGTPLLSLPVEYRDVLQAFHDAYHAPEIAAERKRELRVECRELQLKCGATSAEVARAIGLAAANVSGYLGAGKVEKVRLESAELIRDYLQQRVDAFERPVSG